MEIAAKWQPLTGLILTEQETLSNAPPPSEHAERVEQHLACLQVALALSPSSVFFMSLQDFRFLSANAAALEFLGTNADEIRDFHLRDFLPERDIADFEHLASSIQAGQRDDGVAYISSGDGVGLARVILERVGDIVVGVDQTEPDARLGQASNESDTDPLTKLPNRRLLEHQIQLALDREDMNWGLLFIDLNDYKQVNDLHGHVAGDRVLVDFAKKLKASIRPGDLLARYGGDEFVILVQRIPNCEHLRFMADRISSEVCIEVGSSDPVIIVTASTGCAMASDDVLTVEDMVSAADRDMYRVKRRKAR